MKSPPLAGTLSFAEINSFLSATFITSFKFNLRSQISPVFVASLFSPPKDHSRICSKLSFNLYREFPCEPY